MVSGDMSVAVDTALFMDSCTFHNSSFHLSLDEFEVVVERSAYLHSAIGLSFVGEACNLFNHVRITKNF